MFLQVNVAGTSFMVQAAVEQMQGHSLKENCSVVNLSSISAHQTQPNRQVQRKRVLDPSSRWTYAASKGAINILTKNMALDLAKFRIRVNSVSPGWIWSPEVAKVNLNYPITDFVFKYLTYRQLQTEVAAIGSPLGGSSTSAAGPASEHPKKYQV